jgi:hypothetical protein
METRITTSAELEGMIRKGTGQFPQGRERCRRSGPAKYCERKLQQNCADDPELENRKAGRNKGAR